MLERRLCLLVVLNCDKVIEYFQWKDRGKYTLNWDITQFFKLKFLMTCKRYILLCIIKSQSHIGCAGSQKECLLIL